MYDNVICIIYTILSVYITLFFYFHFFEKNFSSNPNQVLKLANLLNHSKLKYIGTQVQN